jgi:PAS domain S-box-containing protein
MPLENMTIKWYKSTSHAINHLLDKVEILGACGMNSDQSISDVVGQFAEAELRKFFRASEIGFGQVLITDNTGTIEYVNPAFCRVTGYSSQEVLGKTPAILKSERMSAAFYQRLWESLNSGVEWRGEISNRRKDGTYYLEKAVISAIKSNDGSVSHLIKVSEDITDQRHAEEHQQQRLKLIESINSANLDFMESGNLLRMAEIILETSMTVTSSSLAILYEILPNGNAGVLALSMASLDPVPGFQAIQYELLRNGQYEVPLHASLLMAPVLENRPIVVNSPEDNHWKACSCNICSANISTFAGFPLKIGSATIGMIGLANCERGYSQDDSIDLETFSHSCALAISAARAEIIRKSTLDQLRQSQKMEAIGQLAGGISHDFNNLLTVITGYSTLALQKINSDSPAVKDIEQVINAGERATALIRQLLAFGRRQILEPQPLNINIFISSIHRILCRLIGENISLTTNLSRDISMVLADPSQIEQIIMNLVINARDAMERGGVITIGSANCTINSTFVSKNSWALEGDYVVISVRDTGMGMSEEVIARIFEPFFTTKAESGTGLGLATVYGIVKQNNGYIQVLSQIGIGSEFKVYFPRLLKHHVGTELPGIPGNPSIPERGEGLILVVEDEQTVLDFAAVSLRSQGYDVLTAIGPLDALRIFDRTGEKISLVLTDILMPDMTGPEMIKEMRQKHPDVKLLFMSGYSEQKLDSIDLPDEQISFLKKPFTPADLARLVQKCLLGDTTTHGEQKE